jgi:putative flippase GtrA
MDGIGFQLSRFAVVGVVNTLLDMLGFNLLRKFTKLKTVAASYISSTIAMVNSYILNKYWTFESANSGVSAAGEAAKFFGSTIIGIYVIHNGLVWILSEKFTFFSKLAYSITSRLPILNKLSQKFVYDNVAKVAGIAGSLVWNFLLYKFWVFK